MSNTILYEKYDNVKTQEFYVKTRLRNNHEEVNSETHYDKI